MHRKGWNIRMCFWSGVEEGILPHKGDEDEPVEKLAARIEEERRLMYVGITARSVRCMSAGASAVSVPVPPSIAILRASLKKCV
jgi:superfamily I DNA/RNA helicase